MHAGRSNWPKINFSPGGKILPLGANSCCKNWPLLLFKLFDVEGLTDGTEDSGFESRQGVRFLGLHAHCSAVVKTQCALL
jgi:hypothetical protein